MGLCNIRSDNTDIQDALSRKPLCFSLFGVCKSSIMEIFNTFCRVWLFLVTQFSVYVLKNLLCSSSVFCAIGLLMVNLLRAFLVFAAHGFRHLIGPLCYSRCS